MKFGMCCKCENLKCNKNKYWCKKHNKEINDKDIVVCAYFKDKNKTT
jgi:hypothetical protein